MNFPAGRFRQESLDMRIHFYSSVFTHSLQDFDSVALGWAWKAFLSSYIFLGRQCRWGQLGEKCGHQILRTWRVDSLFSSCPGTPKDMRSLFGKRESEMKCWDRLKIWAWAGAGRVGANIFQLLNIDSVFEVRFCIFHKSLVFGGTECFQGPSNVNWWGTEQE